MMSPNRSSVDAAIDLATAARDLGSLDVAIGILETALRDHPGDGSILSCLGTAYQEAGAASRAIETLERALAIDGQNFNAAFNIGNTYGRLGDHAKAMIFYEKAVDIRPSDADARSSLGSTLVYLERHDEASEHFERAHALGDGGAFYNLGTASLYSDDDRAARKAFERAIVEAGDSWPGLASSVMLALLLYLDDQRDRAAQLLQRASAVPSLDETGGHRNDIRNTKAYHRYLSALLSPAAVTRAKVRDDLHVIGDSHVFGIKDAIVSDVHWVLGCKQWHLGSGAPNKYKKKFAATVARLPENAAVLLSLGEIDCRIGGGIFEVWKKQAPGRSLEEIVISTVHPYVDYVARHLSARRRQIILCGVPAVLSGNLKGLTPDERRTYAGMMRRFNASLRDFGHAAGMAFLDLHALTNAGEGMADGSWHIDAVHLRPAAYLEAFKRHYIPATS